MGVFYEQYNTICYILMCCVHMMLFCVCSIVGSNLHRELDQYHKTTAHAAKHAETAAQIDWSGMPVRLGTFFQDGYSSRTVPCSKHFEYIERVLRERYAEEAFQQKFHIIHSVEKNDFDAVKKYLQRGGNPNIDECPYSHSHAWKISDSYCDRVSLREGRTLFLIAVENMIAAWKEEESLKKKRQLQVDVNTHSSKEEIQECHRKIHEAQLNRCHAENIVHLIRDYKADINLKISHGKRPIQPLLSELHLCLTRDLQKPRDMDPQDNKKASVYRFWWFMDFLVPILVVLATTDFI